MYASSSLVALAVLPAAFALVLPNRVVSISPTLCLCPLKKSDPMQSIYDTHVK
jgi:hypothetical protein